MTHLIAAKDQQIRIFRYDAIHIPFLLQKAKLSVRFVRCYDVVHSFRAQSLMMSSTPSLLLPLGSSKPTTHLDELVCHLWGDVHTLRIRIPGQATPLTLE
jgi:hypothetical protein